MVRIAVFGNCPGGRAEIVERSVEELCRCGVPFVHIAPARVFMEESASCSDPDVYRSIFSDIGLRMDLKALASDIIVDLPYSYPDRLDIPHCLVYVSDDVEDRAIGMGFRVVFPDDSIRKYDAAVYLDIDSRVLLDSGAVTGLSEKEIDDWKMFEKYRLRALCRRNNIMYSAFRDPETLVADLAKRAVIVRDSGRRQ